MSSKLTIALISAPIVGVAVYSVLVAVDFMSSLFSSGDGDDEE